MALKRWRKRSSRRLADLGQSRGHVDAGQGDHLILLEAQQLAAVAVQQQAITRGQAQLGQGRLQFLTAPVHLKRIHIGALQAAAALL